MGDCIEKAASGRSRCKTCGVAIDAGELRFGATYIPGADDTYQWHHLACARDAMADRFAVVAAEIHLPADALPPPPDEKLAPLLAVERSPSNRAKCHHCHVAIAKDALRIVVRLPPDPGATEELGFEVKRDGYIHFACAAPYTQATDGLDAYLAKRATKKDQKAVTDYTRAHQLMPKELATAGDASVLGDWLEEHHAIVLPMPDLLQMVGALAPVKPAKKKKR
ncbi:MAG: hypothetical protein QM831_43710 [Kofleriaceae bacterium]